MIIAIDSGMSNNCWLLKQIYKYVSLYLYIYYLYRFQLFKHCSSDSISVAWLYIHASRSNSDTRNSHKLRCRLESHVCDHARRSKPGVSIAEKGCGNISGVASTTGLADYYRYANTDQNQEEHKKLNDEVLCVNMKKLWILVKLSSSTCWVSP